MTALFVITCVLFMIASVAVIVRARTEAQAIGIGLVTLAVCLVTLLPFALALE